MNNQSNPNAARIEMCGALHLHTTFSDGGVDYPTLMSTARQVGLNFVVVTDHMTLKGRQDGFEGFSDGLFVVVGYEHNDAQNINHYLALNTREVHHGEKQPQGYIDAVKRDGGIGFLAHPMEKRHYFKNYPAYPWTAWDAQGFDGIELWNQMSDWLEHLKSWLNFFRLFYPRRFLVGVEKEMLQKWDTCNRISFVSGIGGVDAHSMKTKIGPFGLTVFPIKVELKGIRTHIYLQSPLPSNDPVRARQIFFDALKNGRGFISNFRRADARGALFYIEYADGSIAFPGPQPVQAVLPARMHAHLPDSAEIRFIRNGVEIKRTKGTIALFDITETGLYRIEAYKGKNAWIYSNPFPLGKYPLW